MKKLIDILIKRQTEKLNTMLLTVVENAGSTPGKTGAAMLVGENGYIAGTIGGGMLEYHCTQIAMEYIKKEKGALHQFRLNKDEVANLGMVCGGNLDILFTFVKANDENTAIICEIQHCMNNYGQGNILLSVDGSKILFADETSVVQYMPRGLTEKEYYIIKIQNTARVYVFGAGHLAQELVPLLSHLGFRCVVTDDRVEFCSSERFPQAEEVHVCSFDALDGKFSIQPQDYIIAMTRGHLGDLKVQRFALKTPAYYIGVVGSKSKVKAVNEKLEEAGFTKNDIGRITTPIGVDIHSETPAEIAVSIAAQLVKKRAEYKNNR